MLKHLVDFHMPEFSSNASEFHVTLWNLNFDDRIIGEITSYSIPLIEEIRKNDREVFIKEFIKEPIGFTKEFTKASRHIYKLVSMNPQISIAKMAESMGLSTRQVQKYLNRLQDLHKVARIGGRKTGEWKIIDEEYEGFFNSL